MRSFISGWCSLIIATIYSTVGTPEMVKDHENAIMFWLTLSVINFVAAAVIFFYSKNK